MKLSKLNDYSYRIEKEEGMRVPSIIFASEKLMESIKRDKTLEQARNVTYLPGIQNHGLVMPDGHQGYGCPIGGVAAFDLDEGVVSPGGVGYDINCGVRLIKTDYTQDEVDKKKIDLLNTIFKNVPAGLGSKGKVRLERADLKGVFEKGAVWAVEKGFGFEGDLERIEEGGHLEADFSAASENAIKRGLPQLGSLGSGNHFFEIQRVDEIYDEKTALKFGINSVGQVTLMIHCGSRGLGHQVASDYIREMERKYGFSNLPDRELINAPLKSEVARRYILAMNGAANFAWTNRQLILHWARESFQQVLSSSEGIEIVYDVAHNIAKFEEFRVNGEARKLCIHRKGATRSLGPGRKEIPLIYRDVGQPVIIPGSMGTFSYLLVGTKRAEEVSFGSTAHGAGRVMSRHAALKKFRGERVKSDLSGKGIELKGTSWKGIAEEAPGVYKDINEVVRVSNVAGIGTLVARLRPIGVIKG